MVWQIKKLIVCFVCVLVLSATLCCTVQGATHTVYENGSLGTTYITYFKDILSGLDFRSDYVAFRSGQYEYLMVVGDLDYNNGVISLADEGKQYRFYTSSSSYQSQYYYDVSNISNFSINTNNSILYSNIGDFPELIERGAKYEILNTLLLVVFGLAFVIRRIFYSR